VHTLTAPCAAPTSSVMPPLAPLQASVRQTTMAVSVQLAPSALARPSLAHPSLVPDSLTPTSPPLSYFAIPAQVYPHCAQEGAPMATTPPTRPDDWLVVHPVEVARLEQHVHPMVIRRIASIVKPVDQLVLEASTSSPLCPEPSFTHSALADPIWTRSTPPWSPTTPGTWYLTHLAPMS
jgi:hypothetical protein